METAKGKEEAIEAAKEAAKAREHLPVQEKTMEELMYEEAKANGLWDEHLDKVQKHERESNKLKISKAAKGTKAKKMAETASKSKSETEK